MNSKTDIKKIRPSARIITTIGSDLVGDSYASIVELVKNGYDADANKVEIIFDYLSKEELTIEIRDDGHGMSTDKVINKWLVPATKDKLDRQTSPNGRLFQGRKGIGRYAAANLGQEMLLKTIDKKGEKTEIYIDWSLFDSNEFLDDVDILVTSVPTNENSGTVISISAKGEKVSQWGRNELDILSKELRKLKSPLKYYSEEQFDIQLAFFNCPFEEYNNQVFEIDSYPIIEFYDYNISGSIDEHGNVQAIYRNNSEPNLPSDNIQIKIVLKEGDNYCGPIQFDFRVFDRDNEAIGNLINKGLIDPISKLAMGKREARQELDRIYGVNLYREGFRIRPYGNGGIDWLNLDKNRIQNPSFKIGNNQVVGFVNIKPEEISHLEEKSARDGLKENGYYSGLVSLLKTVLLELENRRFDYRQKAGKGRKAKNINNEIEELLNFQSLTDQIKKKLFSYGIKPEKINDIAIIIQKEAETKSKLLENIQNTVAIYQGQATLGKIVTVLLHEGRKPVSYFRQASQTLVKWLSNYKLSRDWENKSYDEIMNRLVQFEEQGIMLSDLFKKLDPLAKQNRGPKKDFSLMSAIIKAKNIFELTLEESKIAFSLNCEHHIIINGWEEDIIIAITNLIENSVYWLNIKNSKDKEIKIIVVEDKNIIIHYRDNGPGIDKSSIESGSIFEPGVSKKLYGTGLGLPIAGEALERLDGSILAIYSDEGAYFTLELKKKE